MSPLISQCRLKGLNPQAPPCRGTLGSPAPEKGLAHKHATPHWGHAKKYQAPPGWPCFSLLYSKLQLELTHSNISFFSVSCFPFLECLLQAGLRGAPGEATRSQREMHCRLAGNGTSRLKVNLQEGCCLGANGWQDMDIKSMIDLDS